MPPGPRSLNLPNRKCHIVPTYVPTLYSELTHAIMDSNERDSNQNTVFMRVLSIRMNVFERAGIDYRRTSSPPRFLHKMVSVWYCQREVTLSYAG